MVRKLESTGERFLPEWGGQSDGDYIVHTEFGADMWTYVIEVGFSAARIHSFEYPAALAIEATKFIGDKINE